MTREKTYCPICPNIDSGHWERDAGTVLIWHPKALSALRDGGWDLTDCLVPCSCRAGLKQQELMEARNGVPPARYGERPWHVRRTIRSRAEHQTRGNCPVGPFDGDWHPLRPDWDVEDYGSDQIKNYVAGKHPRHVNQFDDFNNR